MIFAVDLGSHEWKGVLLGRRWGRWALKQIQRVTAPEHTTQGVAVFRQLWETCGQKNPKVVVTLPDRAVLPVVVRLEAGKRFEEDELRRVIQWQARDHWLTPHDQLVVQWQSFWGRKGQPSVVVGSLVDRGVLSTYEGFLQSAGVSRWVIDAAPYRALNSVPDAAFDLVHVGATHTTVWMVEDHRPLAVHRLPVGGAMFTQAIGQHRRVSLEHAEKGKRSIAFLPEDWGVPGTEGRLATLEGVMPALKRWTTFIHDALAASLRRDSMNTRVPLYLAGGGAGWARLDVALQQVLGRPVTLWHPRVMSELTMTDQLLPAGMSWTALSASVGAAWSARKSR